VSKRRILEAIGELAFGAEMLDDRRARSWGGAVWALRNAEGDVVEMTKDGTLTDLRGVGKSTLAVAREALAGTEPKAVTEMRAKLPVGLFELRRIRGLGPKKIKLLWKDLGIESLAELEYACRENRLLKLDGFGPKTQAKVLAQIAELKESVGKVRRDRAQGLLETVLPELEALPGVERVEVAGGYRRGFEVMRSVDVVVAGDPGGYVAEEPLVVHRASLEGFGWAWLRASASEEHVAALEARAEERGVDLGAIPEEDEVYERLGLLPTPPERRDAATLTVAGKARPRLVRREDLRGALHNHTTASDGKHSLEQMQQAAAAAGLAYFGISEHSVTASYARGLDAERLRAQREAIAKLNEDATCVLLRGVESDILSDGSLDYEDEVLAELEFVVASVHQRYSQGRDAMTARLSAAARHPATTVIGHPTGRLLLGRPGAEIDMEELLEVCAETGCAMELNANPARLDLSAEHLAMAKERGVKISIAADAHAMDEIANLEHGVAVARRAGLTPEDVVNCLPLEDFRSWLAQRHG